jgi:hypothetical protein
LAIDIGPGATDRAGYFDVDYTYVDKANPANATGNIDTFECWFTANSTGVECACFSASGDVLTTTDFETIGNVTGGSKQTFTGLSMSVTLGDYLGIHWTIVEGRGLEQDSSGGSGMWYMAGDNIPCTSVTFGSIGSYVMSIYGTGTETAASKPYYYALYGKGTAN